MIKNNKTWSIWHSSLALKFIQHYNLHELWNSFMFLICWSCRDKSSTRHQVVWGAFFSLSTCVNKCVHSRFLFGSKVEAGLINPPATSDQIKMRSYLHPFRFDSRAGGPHKVGRFLGDRHKPFEHWTGKWARCVCVWRITPNIAKGGWISVYVCHIERQMEDFVCWKCTGDWCGFSKYDNCFWIAWQSKTRVKCFCCYFTIIWIMQYLYHVKWFAEWKQFHYITHCRLIILLAFL